MAIAEIAEAVFRFLDDKIGIQVSVFLLGPSDQGDDVVGGLFQFGVGVFC